MGKWVLGLCVSMYAVLILFGGEGYDAEKYAVAEPALVVEAEEVEVTRAATIVTPIVEVTVDDPGTTGSEDSTVLIAPVETAALDENASEVIATSVEVTEPARPTLVLQPASTSVASSAAIVAEPAATETVANSPIGQIWTVTGNRVNLRAGASTRNAVIGAAVRGDSAEIVEMLDNGWAKVYIIETGLEAYMSAKFIAPEQG